MCNKTCDWNLQLNFLVIYYIKIKWGKNKYNIKLMLNIFNRITCRYKGFKRKKNIKKVMMYGIIEKRS